MIHAVIEQWHAHMRGELKNGLDILLDDNCVFFSPIVFTPQVGKEITKMYLMAAGQTLPGDTENTGETKDDSTKFRYTKEVLDKLDAWITKNFCYGSSVAPINVSGE